MTDPTADTPPITGHVFRSSGGTIVGGVSVGMCIWLGACNRPQDDHITHLDFRARRGAR